MPTNNDLIKERVIALCDLLIDEERSHQQMVPLLEVIKSLVGSIDRPPRSRLTEFYELNRDHQGIK